MATLEIKGNKRYIKRLSEHLKEEHPSTKSRMEVQMKNNHIKTYTKDSMTLVKTGIGLSVGAGVIGAVGGNAGMIAPLAKGVGTLGSLNVMKTTTGIISDLGKKIKKKY